MTDDLRKAYLSTPSDLTNEALGYALSLKEKSVPFFVPELDKEVGGISLPMRKGEVILIHARPGNGKTTLGITLVNGIGMNMPRERRPIFVTGETIVEDTAVYLMAYISRKYYGKNYTSEDFYLGKVPDKELVDYSVGLSQLNMYIIGRKWGNFGKVEEYSPLNLDTIYKILHALREEGKDPCLLAIDYLQKFQPVDTKWRDNKQKVVLKTIEETEHFAITAGIPILMLAQSRREVDDYAIPIPNLSDIQWTSASEQIGDRVYSLWRPAAYPKFVYEEYIELHGTMYENHENLLFINKFKERGTKMVDFCAVDFSPGTLEINSLKKTGNFNNVDDVLQGETNPKQGRISF